MYEIHKTTYFAKWIDTLDDLKGRVKILVRIERLALGNTGDVKAVGEGVSELRIDYGPGYRVYYKKKGKELIFLLIGGDKSSQAKDIALAKQLAKEL
jgi:putative addiction module killer protein